MITITEEQLNVYMRLFRGREDVYARRWEKNGTSGYSPAYEFDWNEFLAFKRSGGSMKTFQNKRALPLTREMVRRHLLGQYVLGIYPIVENGKSYFIAADFDGEQWVQDAIAVVKVCKEFNLPAYIERSRSGNGGHVWLFFESAYPCYKSRAIMLELIRHALHLSEFDKEVSFDRLFPNQDTLAKDGLGNLIALPLQGRSRDKGNTVFVDSDTLQPYSDQWEFLQGILPLSSSMLDSAWEQVTHGIVVLKNHIAGTHTGLTITLDNRLHLLRSELSPMVVTLLKEKLNFINSEYLVKRRLGKSVYKVQKFFKLIEEQDDEVIIPRGFVDQLTRFLEEQSIPYAIADHRAKVGEVKIASSITLYPEQQLVIESTLKKDQGVIVAPAGSGKTIIGLQLVACRSLPALILVHRKQLLDQWVERIQSFLGIAQTHIGQYYGVKKSIGKQVTVAMMQSLSRTKDWKDIRDTFGTVIVDECHHIPAKTFREVMDQLNPRFVYGLTATPKRKHNDQDLIFTYLGNIISEMPEQEQATLAPTGTSENRESHTAPTIIIRTTELAMPFKFTTDNFQLLAKIITFDTYRNQLITKDITEQVANQRKVLVLSERRDHLEVLNLYLKGMCETIVVSGEDSASSRASKLAQIHAGHYQVILSTGQFFGEGLDIPTIDCLVLAFPFAFEGKLTQYIGRLRGNVENKVIIDYHDEQITFLDKQFKQRQRIYNRLQGKVKKKVVAIV